MAKKNKALPTPGEWKVHDSKSNWISIEQNNEELFQWVNDEGNNVPDQPKTNAHAVCLAINNTYGSGINPERVPSLLQAFKNVRSQLIDSGHWTEQSVFIKVIDLEIEKVEL